MKQTLWCFTLAAIGVLAMLTQLDRQSRYQSDLAELVPENMRYFAQYHSAEAALSRGDGAAALTEARTLVARRPIPAGHLRLLASAQLLNEENGAGTATLQLAGQRGWRDTPTQFALLSFAEAQRDGTQMARRYFAIWVQQENREALKPWAKIVFANPDALAEAT
ncbi:MAG: hypothetical protein ABJX46_04565, partial [Erythrobacter sp.]